jgi:hypothetical protein
MSLTSRIRKWIAELRGVEETSAAPTAIESAIGNPHGPHLIIIDEVSIITEDAWRKLMHDR